MPVLIIISLFLGTFFIMLEVFSAGFGAFGITGVICYLLGAVFTYLFIPDFFMTAILFEIVIAILFFVILYHLLKDSDFVNSIILKENLKEDKVIEFSEDFVGKTGICKTPLKPVGIVTVDKKDYEVLSSSEYVDKGDEVIIKSAKKGKIIVEPK